MDIQQVLAVDQEQVKTWQLFRDAVPLMSATDRDAQLSDRAQSVRRDVLEMIANAGQGHIGGDFSVTDILTALFDSVLRIDPSLPDWPERDRFILSKGHCSAALYATLAHCGYFSATELTTFMQPLSALNGHPNRNKVPGVETNTGPLGHGLPFAVGVALAAKLQKLPSRVFVVLGDGEMQEGSNWEALMSASQYGLDNLTAIVDRNRLQQGARTEETNGLDPLDERLASFGFEVRIAEGHDFSSLTDALSPSTTSRPVGVIANTIKGKGVSFIEDRVEWHHKVPSADQVAAARLELS